jgi:hypothetical protein
VVALLIWGVQETPSKTVRFGTLSATVRFANKPGSTFAPPPASARPALTPDRAFIGNGDPNIHLTNPHGPDAVYLGLLNIRAAALGHLSHLLAWGYARRAMCGGTELRLVGGLEHPCTDWLFGTPEQASRLRRGSSLRVGPPVRVLFREAIAFRTA